MSGGELALTLIVALVVFGPSKLPMLAEHLGKLLRSINQLKQQGSLFWQTQVKEQELQESIRRAEEADAIYKKGFKPKGSDSLH